jgi:hypothetical protein
MSDSTTELGLQLAVDADDTADYLTIRLRQSLQSLDATYNQAGGHTHSGPHQGGAISSGAFLTALDLPDWFRSTGHRTAYPSSGQGIEMYWDGANAVLQGYDRGASTWRPLVLAGSSIILQTAGSTRLTVDNAGNVTMGASLTVNGTLLANGVQVNGTVAIGNGLSVTGGNVSITNNLTVSGTTTLQAASATTLHATGAATLDSALTVGGTLVVTGITTLATTLNVNGGQINLNNNVSIYLTGTGAYRWTNGASIDTSGGSDMNAWIPAGGGNFKVQHNGGGWAGVQAAAFMVQSSPRAFKTDIAPIGERALQLIGEPSLRGVRFNFRDGGAPNIGFVADDWLAHVPEIVNVDAQGQVAGMDYMRVTAILWEVVRDLVRRLQPIEEESLA